VFELFPRLEQRKFQSGRQLSGGEQEMLAIARPLLLNPRLMLLDEPSQGLAPLVVREVIQVIRRMRDDGLSVLLIEQNVPLSLAVADRAYVLDDGRMVYSGRAGDLATDIELVNKLAGAGKRAALCRMGWAVHSLRRPIVDGSPECLEQRERHEQAHRRQQQSDQQLMIGRTLASQNAIAAPIETAQPASSLKKRTITCTMLLLSRDSNLGLDFRSDNHSPWLPDAYQMRRVCIAQRTNAAQGHRSCRRSRARRAAPGECALRRASRHA
jgi:ABC-type multidrug transport system ATPase subunit